jgi:hypothetical protein
MAQLSNSLSMLYSPSPQILAVAIMASIFGQGSSRPKRAAALRLLGMVVGAVVCGVGLQRAVDTIPLPALPLANLLFFPAILALQTMVLAGLAAAHGTLQPAFGDRLSRWLMLLPITTLQGRYLRLLPALTLAGLLSIVSGLPLGTFLHTSGMSFELIGVAIGIGSITALAIYHLSYQLPVLLRIISYGSFIAGEYALITVITDP